MSIPCCIYSPGIALAFPFQEISEGSRFGLTNEWKTAPCSFDKSMLQTALVWEGSYGEIIVTYAIDGTQLQENSSVTLDAWSHHAVADDVPMCCAASENMLGCSKGIRTWIFQSDRPIFCVCSPCLSMLQIHLQPLKKNICHVPREPNITLLLVCNTLVYLVLIWTMAIIVSIATSDSFYSYCCFNCFCSNFYGFVFGIVSFSIFTMSCNCSSCSYHCGFCCCCCKMQEVLMFVRCFLARRLCLKEGYSLRPLNCCVEEFWEEY